MESAINLNELKYQLKQVISYSQDMNDPKVDKILDIWYKNKKHIYDIFENKLIIESDDLIEIELEQSEIEAKIDKFLDEIQEKYNYRQLFNFISDQKPYFCDNLVQEDWDCDYLNIHIPKGMKITKAFKYFIQDKDDLDAVQTMASRIIQEKKVTGYLCLSIHPLDYLSSAESTYNWRSCHALDGEHRAGNLSYMLDTSTIVCYLRGEHDVKLPHFPTSVPWNSKKWRMLLFLSDNYDAMFAGRHYPFFSKSLMIKVKKMFVTLLQKHDSYYTYIWSKWHNDNIDFAHFKVNNEDDFVLNDRYVFLNNNLYPMHQLITDKGSLHFNDLLFSSIYQNPYYCWRKLPNYRMTPHFTIGHDVPCLCCEQSNILDSSMMVCDNCDNGQHVICEKCGRTINVEDAIWIDEDEMYVCRDCYNDM